MNGETSVRDALAAGLEDAPIIGVVRTADSNEARRQAESLIQAGVALIEITFTVPQAVDLCRSLLEQRGSTGPPWIGMGTVTNGSRARRAISAGAEFVVSPNVEAEVAAEAKRADRFLVLGALTCSEIVNGHALGADLIKVYPLPPVGGPSYLEVVRGPLGDIPMLAAGGFGIEDIPAYRRVGAVAFGIGAPLLGDSDEETKTKVERALKLARGQEP